MSATVQALLSVSQLCCNPRPQSQSRKPVGPKSICGCLVNASCKELSRDTLQGFFYHKKRGDAGVLVPL